MSLNDWEQDIAAYQAVLEDFYSGKLKLQQGQDEFIADLRQRILRLQEKVDGRTSSGDGSFDGEESFAG